MTSQTVWLVEYLPDAVRELDSFGSRQEKKSLFNVVDKLEALGPALVPPHMKGLKGEPNLMELRPRQGGSAVRLIYARVENGYKILAIACNKDEFQEAVRHARQRADKYSISLGR